MDDIKQLLKDNDAKVIIIKEKRRDSENLKCDALKSRYCIDNFASTRTTTWKDEDIRSSIEQLKLSNDIERKRQLLNGLDNTEQKKQIDKIKTFIKDFNNKMEGKQESDHHSDNDNITITEQEKKSLIKEDYIIEDKHHQLTFKNSLNDHNSNKINNDVKTNVKAENIKEEGTQTLPLKTYKLVAKSFQSFKFNKFILSKNRTKQLHTKPKSKPIIIKPKDNKSNKSTNKDLLSNSKRQRTKSLPNPSINSSRLKHHCLNTFSLNCNIPKSNN